MKEWYEMFEEAAIQWAEIYNEMFQDWDPEEISPFPEEAGMNEQPVEPGTTPTVLG